MTCSSLLLIIFFSSEKEAEIGRLEFKDQQTTLLFNGASHIAEENAKEARTWEQLHAEAVASHKSEVEKLDSRLAGK